MTLSREHIRRIKGALLLAGILILGSVLVLFLVHQEETLPNRSDISPEERSATVSLKGIIHADIQDGVQDWLLKAESAELHTDEKKAFLSSIQATFFDRNGEPVVLSAESGTWNTDSNDLEVSGNVMLKNKQYEMRTERLTYAYDKRMFETQSPVAIHGFMNQTASGMTYFLDSGQIDFRNVEGEIGNGDAS